MNEQNDGVSVDVAQGLHAGAIASIAQARRFGTNIAIWRDGKIVEITPDEAEALLKEREAEKEGTC
ncbi:MAG: hypothetical protein P4M13_01530 [Alphaproteobacteria bacterium]|nr:hypothetical protein [Alphaproteobacteria bacterium]